MSNFLIDPALFVFTSAIILYIATHYQIHYILKDIPAHRKSIYKRDIIRAMALKTREEDDIANFKIFASYWVFIVLYIVTTYLYHPKAWYFMGAMLAAVLSQMFMEWRMISKVAYVTEDKNLGDTEAKIKAWQEDPTCERSLLRTENKLIYGGDDITLKCQSLPAKECIEKKMKNFKEFINPSNLALFNHFSYPKEDIFFKTSDHTVYQGRVLKSGDIKAESVSVAPTEFSAPFYKTVNLETYQLIQYLEAFFMSLSILFSLWYKG